MVLSILLAAVSFTASGRTKDIDNDGMPNGWEDGRPRGQGRPASALRH